MPHIRLLDPEHGSTSLANLFGLPYVIEAKSRPFDRTTLHNNWQRNGTEAFSLYTGMTGKIDDELATQAANDTNTSVDRQSIKDEIEQLNEELDRIITEAKELGIHFFVLTGGEPMVRKKDILMLAEKHNDCAFHCYTNGTLVDQNSAMI